MTAACGDIIADGSVANHERHTLLPVMVYAIRVRDGKNGVLVEGSGVEIFKECEILKRGFGLDEKEIV